MHIVQVHLEKTPVKHYGGTERVVEALCNGLLEMGHKVTLLSYRGDYIIPGVQHIYLDQYKKNVVSSHFLKLAPSDADIFHFHIPLKQDLLHIPYVTTLHGNLKAEEDLRTLPKNTICLSQDHAKRHLVKHFVYNGLDYRQIPFRSVPFHIRNYFAFLGRASLKRKGLHNAKIISKETNLKLHVGGGRGLSFGNTRYLGHLDNIQKFELLKNAKALLFPIEWEEPFGLVMVEAMMCGTPVFAFQRGAVPEILKTELDFNLVDRSLDELIQRIKDYEYKVEPDKIRAVAIEKFSHFKMCEGYLKHYQQVLG